MDLPEIGDASRNDALMEVIRNRVTVRKFDSDIKVPNEHFEMIIEAARHGPTGANSQPWQFIVVRDPDLKLKIASFFVAKQRFRAKAKMNFPTLNYCGLATVPGFVVVRSDTRWVKGFPVLNEKSALDRSYLKALKESCCSRLLRQQCRRIWRRPPEEVLHWDHYNSEHFMTDDGLQDWIKTQRHRVT